MRFDSPAHLDAWRDLGAYPWIHNAIDQVIVACMRGSRFLDLGCSYGLLALRVSKQLDTDVAIGVDADAKAIQLAAAAGVAATVKFYRLKIVAETLPQLVKIVQRHGIDVIAARRILPELFGDSLQLGRTFAGEMRAAGVKEIFLEGRKVSDKSVNALRSIEEEVELLSGSFREVRRVGAASYLVAVSGGSVTAPPEERP